MKTNLMKLVPFIFYADCVPVPGRERNAEQNYKLDYQAKVQQNDATIGIIAGVINYVCPRLVPASTQDLQS